MKLIKRLIIITLIIAAFLAGSVYHEARQVYKQAVADTPIEEKVAQIQSIEHYTPYSQLQKTYVEAVIAAEDKRFETHKGYSLICGKGGMEQYQIGKPSGRRKHHNAAAGS